MYIRVSFFDYYRLDAYYRLTDNVQFASLKKNVLNLNT